MPRTYTRSTVPAARPADADLKGPPAGRHHAVTTSRATPAYRRPRAVRPPVIVLDGVGEVRSAPTGRSTTCDLSVPGGQITVLLGPNGAGKTTAIRTITGAFAPDAGTVRVFGLDPAGDGDEVRRPLRRRVGQAGALRPPVRARQPPLLGRAYGLGRGTAVDARIARGRRPLRDRGRPRRPGGRLLHRHEDPAGPGPRACCTDPSSCSTTSRRRASTPSRRTPCSS